MPVALTNVMRTTLSRNVMRRTIKTESFVKLFQVRCRKRSHATSCKKQSWAPSCGKRSKQCCVGNVPKQCHVGKNPRQRRAETIPGNVTLEALPSDIMLETMPHDVIARPVSSLSGRRTWLSIYGEGRSTHRTMLHGRKNSMTDQNTGAATPFWKRADEIRTLLSQKNMGQRVLKNASKNLWHWLDLFHKTPKFISGLPCTHRTQGLDSVGTWLPQNKLDFP